MASGQPISCNAARGPCVLCGEEGLPCGRCRCDYYCSKAHQRRHWPRHKAGCGALEVREDPLLGRHLVATRDITAGTLLLRENPVVVFPQSTPDADRMFCVGCSAVIGGQWQQCARCGLPMCFPKVCSGIHAHQPECAEFQRAKFKLKRGDLKDATAKEAMLRGVAALRTLLASKTHPSIKNLQSDYNSLAEKHMQACNPQWAMLLSVSRLRWMTAARWVREAGLTWFSEDELRRAAAINQINSHSGTGVVRVGVTQTPPDHSDAEEDYSGYMQSEGSELRLGLSLLEHSCSPNTMTEPADRRLALLGRCSQEVTYAARDVRRGEHLSSQYVEVLLEERDVRRDSLRHWGFVCRCERCGDTSERGLHLAAPCCPHCAGKGKQCVMAAEDPGEDKPVAAYRCSDKQGCGKQMSVAAVQKLLAIADAELLVTKRSSIGGEYGSVDPEMWQAYLKRHLHPSGPLHATHRLALLAKKEMVEAMVEERINKAGPDQLRRWQATCEEMVSVIETLQGMCQTYGSVVSALTRIDHRLEHKDDRKGAPPAKARK